MTVDVILQSGDEQMAQCVEQSYSPLFASYHFNLVDMHNEGMRHCYIFQSQFFRFQLCNESGHIEGTLAPIHNTSRYFDIGLLKALLTLKQAPYLTQWDVKKLLTTPLTCEEQATFVDTQHDLLVELLSIANYKETRVAMEDLAVRRADLLYWSKARK